MSSERGLTALRQQHALALDKAEDAHRDQVRRLSHLRLELEHAQTQLRATQDSEQLLRTQMESRAQSFRELELAAEACASSRQAVEALVIEVETLHQRLLAEEALEHQSKALVEQRRVTLEATEARILARQVSDAASRDFRTASHQNDQNLGRFQRVGPHGVGGSESDGEL